MEENKEQISPPKIKRSLFRKIINTFIGIFLGVIFLSVILLGFTQTKTFRDYLRDTIVEEVNSSINGKLSIEKIEGTILTSVFLRNTTLTTSGDTLLSAHNVVVKINILQLMLKKIYIRNVLLENAKIKLLQDENGNWNYANLVKPTEEDTAKSSFSFFIEVNDLQLRNIDLVQQSNKYLGSTRNYQAINFDDLRISNLYLTAQAFIDIESSNYLLLLKELSFKPNLNRFTLRNISGEFAITKDFASVKHFALITDSSDVRLNARLDSLNLFGNVELEDFKNYPVSIDLDASSFNFDDLSSFIGSTEILKGNPSVELKASGKFGGFKIQKLVVDYKTTHFEIGGEVLKLNTPENLFIKAKITDTDINYKDVNALLPSLQLPEFAKLSVSSVNIEYEGEPTNFKTKFSGNIENGYLEFDCSMNVAAKPMTYDIKFKTADLDLSPVIGLTTLLNSDGSLVGKGVSPADLNANLNFAVENSTFDNFPIEYFKINSAAKDRLVDLEVEGKSNRTDALIIGNVEFDNDTIPTYSLVGSIQHLDVSTISKDEENKSDLNFYFSAEGRHIDLDNIVGTFSFGIDSSSYLDTRIDYSNVDIDFKKEQNFRAINLKSDFVDFNIDGNFSLNDAVKLVAYEGQTITDAISAKLNELNPLSVVNQSSEQRSLNQEIPDIVNKGIEFNYNFNFKDFSLIAAVAGLERLDVIGSGNGKIINQTPNFTVNSEINLKYFILVDKESTVYISDVITDLNFTRDNRYVSFDNIFGTASLTGKRFYTTGNIKNIKADIVFNQSKLFFNVSASYEDYLAAEAEGTLLMTPIEQQINIDKININYDGLVWSNKKPVSIFFNPYRFNIADCSLYHDTTYASLSGTIESSGEQKLNFELGKISGNILSKYFINKDDPNLIANGKLRARINGDFEDPIINTTINIDNLAYKKFNLGKLTGSILYSDKKVSTDIKFLDSTYNIDRPLLTFSGTIPVDLSFTTVKNRFLDSEEINLRLYSDNFNIRSLGNLLPFVKNQSGNLLANLIISGKIDALQYSGFMRLIDGYFVVENTNMPYEFSVDMKFDQKGLLINNFELANSGGTKYPGQIKGVGSAVFDGFKIDDLSIRFAGDLAVLGEQSRATSPLFYGDLRIGTESDALLTMKNNRLFFKSNILLKETNLTLKTTEQAAQSNSDFNFIYVVDSTKIDKELIKFQEVLSSGKNNKVENDEEPNLNIDYEVGVEVENSARMTFILSQAVNQRLLVEMRGELRYVTMGGATRAQGAFTLMPGSKLEFFKTFDAEGLLRFESDVTNPYLDIIATYTSDYINPRDVSALPQEVAVKIKIRGLLNDLGRNLASNPESIGVYVGSRDIQNNVRETSYDYADAFSFILIGKFKDDLTAQDRAQVAGQTNAIGNTATSFLGSVLTNFVNSAVGDLINNIQISQTGDYTKFSLSGRIQNLRYSFGGTTELFQNLNKANIKVEYLFDPRFLIRVERKDPIVQTFGLDEKINEIALKYRFEF
ncbi:MAG: AsmA family protein [Bacteroidota bacterium]